MKKIMLVLSLLFTSSFVRAEDFEGRITKMSAVYSNSRIEITLDSGDTFNVLSNDPLYSMKILFIVQSAFATNSKISVQTQYKDKLATVVTVVKD